MKPAKYLFLSAALFFTISCTTDKNITVNATQENTNASQESANSQTSQQDAAFDAEAPLTGAQQAVPEELVKDLYKTHEKDEGAILSGKNRKILDKYFDKNLANLIWKDLTTHQDEIGVIDFDIFYNTQDPQIKNLKVNPAKIEGTKATVPVTFTNGGAKETVTYLLTQQNGDWKISDIKYRDAGTLLKIFKENEQLDRADNSSKEGNFEGVYQVGNTTATVKPIKMAFELKWAKGSGTLIFHYAGQGVLEYVSEDSGDRFIFDDTTFTTGTFIRGSDEKEMPVKKIR
jgi:Zn/Cd-binding protein ZinT